LQEAAIKEMEQEDSNMLQEEGMQDEMVASQDSEREETDRTYNPNIEEKKRKLKTNEQKHKGKKCKVDIKC
jgi:hypothetical protein